MAEPNKQQIGDGADNYGSAVNNAAKVAKQATKAGKEWAMRHTLFKILVCICLCVVFLIVLIVELPGILINRALGLDGSQPTEQVTIVTVFETVTDVISNIIYILELEVHWALIQSLPLRFSN